MGQDPTAAAREEALAAELLGRLEEEHRIAGEARTLPAAVGRLRMGRCRAENGDALKGMVARHGWPSADLVGEPASTAALVILLHTSDLGFQLCCRDLIAAAVDDGGCPPVHHAYIADHCAVELGRPQFYGTRVDPRTLRPYPLRQPATVDERRRDVGLPPLGEQLRALRSGLAEAGPL